MVELGSLMMAEVSGKEKRGEYVILLWKDVVRKLPNGLLDGATHLLLPPHLTRRTSHRRKGERGRVVEREKEGEDVPFYVDDV